MVRARSINVAMVAGRVPPTSSTVMVDDNAVRCTDALGLRLPGRFRTCSIAIVSIGLLL